MLAPRDTVYADSNRISGLNGHEIGLLAGALSVLYFFFWAFWLSYYVSSRSSEKRTGFEIGSKHWPACGSN